MQEHEIPFWLLKRAQKVRYQYNREAIFRGKYFVYKVVFRPVGKNQFQIEYYKKSLCRY